MEPFWHKLALAMAVDAAIAERSSARQLLTDELGAERASARQYVYLVTISRALTHTQVAEGFRNVNDLTREFVSNAVPGGFLKSFSYLAAAVQCQRLLVDRAGFKMPAVDKCI